MGRFGIEFSDKNNAPFKINKKRHYGTVNHSRSRIGSDTAFQRGLAWASYYVLVFAALCVFNQPALAGIFDKTSGVSNSLHVSDNPAKPVSWELRTTKSQ
jgi:hypothetical protein